MIWEVSGPELPVISDQFFVDRIVAYQVNELGVVRFDIPHVYHPTKARLELRWSVVKSLIAAAEQELYVFPSDVVLLEEHWNPVWGVAQAAAKRTPVLASGARERGKSVYAPEFQPTLEYLDYEVVDALFHTDLAIVTTLDDACREFLLRGGRVLLLAEKDDALQTYIPGLGIEPRTSTAWQGDWASSFGWHRFERLPTDNVINFAFADLTPEHVIHGFAPRDFALDVYAGLFVGWLHKPIPTIARKRVGRGELLVSTFRLAKNLETNPLARYLLAELMMLIEASGANHGDSKTQRNK